MDSYYWCCERLFLQNVIAQSRAIQDLVTPMSKGDIKRSVQLQVIHAPSKQRKRLILPLLLQGTSKSLGDSFKTNQRTCFSFQPVKHATPCCHMICLKVHPNSKAIKLHFRKIFSSTKRSLTLPYKCVFKLY